MVPVGAAIAACYYLGASGQPSMYLVAVGLTLVRMYLGTLDGLMAEHFQKSTPLGAIVNRVAPELCDVMYLSSSPWPGPSGRRWVWESSRSRG